jgi:hypothetical protein
LFKEFVDRIHQFYITKYGKGSVNEQLCRAGYYYEPSVAEMIFNQMVEEEENIELFTGCRMEHVTTGNNVPAEIHFRDRPTRRTFTLKGKIYVDATYEGDLYAMAGAGYRTGREGKDTYGESHAGRIFFDHQENRMLDGSTGEADQNLPAYTYRLCLTDDPDNSYVLTEPPPGYKRSRYTSYLKDLKEGRLGGPKHVKEGHGYFPLHFDTMVRVFSFTEIPNRKFDVNINPRPLGFPFPELNNGYPEASHEERERMAETHRELTLGLLYFIQNDPEVPEAHRQMANLYHLPLDEFTDNEHFPWQLYIREARRLKGRYVLTENDLESAGGDKRSDIFYDSVMAGEFPIDSFPVTKAPDGTGKVLEGYIGMLEVRPYQVPLRIMLPEAANNLIVPVAASTSHIAYSSIRMEPLWMGLGQAAGTLAHMSIHMTLEPGSVPVNRLQKQLLADGQILTYFYDMDLRDKAFKAVQFWGTKGFFDSYHARSHAPIMMTEFKAWLEIFTRELNIPGSEHGMEEGNMPMAIADFRNAINQIQAKLSANIGKEQPFMLDNKDSVCLYKQRDPGSPVQRGEVCMSFFNLYFNVKNYVEK